MRSMLARSENARHHKNICDLCKKLLIRGFCNDYDGFIYLLFAIEFRVVSQCHTGNDGIRSQTYYSYTYASNERENKMYGMGR